MAARRYEEKGSRDVQGSYPTTRLWFCMMGLMLMVVGSTVISPRPALALGISPERAQELLVDMAPLLLPTHGHAKAGVKSTLLCF